MTSGKMQSLCTLAILLFVLGCGPSSGAEAAGPPTGGGVSGGGVPVPALVFSVQPSSTMADFVMSPVTVEYQNAPTTYVYGDITVAIGTNPVGGTLLGSVTTMAPVGGAATFSNLRLDQPGTGYTLIAYTNGPVNFATSRPFDVTPPSPPVATVTVTPGNVDALAGDRVSFVATTLDAAGSALTGRWVTWAVNGPAMLMGAGVACGLQPGTVTITATSEGKSSSALLNVTGSSSPGCCEAGC